MRLKTTVVMTLALIASPSPTCWAALPKLEFQSIWMTTFVSNDQLPSEGTTSLSAPFFPSAATLEASAFPSASSNVIDLSIIGDQYVLTFNVNHTSDGPVGFLYGPGAKSIGHIAFRTFEVTPIEMSGYYKVFDFDENSHAYSELNVRVTDYGSVGPNKFSFSNVHASLMTHNAQYKVGEAGGDWPESHFYNEGVPKGLLLTGRQYFIDFDMQINTTPPGELGQLPGATAVGKFIVKLGGPVVPEPTSAAIAVLFLAAGATTHRARRPQRIRSRFCGDIAVCSQRVV